MILSPLRLLMWLLGVAVVGAPLAAIALYVIATTGSPGSCDEDGSITIGPEHVLAFHAKMDALTASLDAGRPSSAVFSENEVSSRARLWAEQQDVPVSDLLISGKVDIPVFPGDVDVLVRGTLDLTGERPVVRVDDIEVGGLPGPFTDLATGLIDELIEDQVTKLELTHDYTLAFAEGEVTIDGTP
jgi:hypothetical protein